MQPPWLPERRITTGSYLERHLRAWSSASSAFPTQADIDRCQEALGAWPAPHCALEYHRWLVRSRLRSDGRAFAALVRRPVEAPVLLINGSDDPALARPAVDASGRSVRGPVTQRTIDAAGHFPHEEQPSSVTETLLQWLSERASTGVDLTG
jgi:pimeloyl-ACP methyl ester carboxylesterase